MKLPSYKISKTNNGTHGIDRSTH